MKPCKILPGSGFDANGVNLECGDSAGGRQDEVQYLGRAHLVKQGRYFTEKPDGERLRWPLRPHL